MMKKILLLLLALAMVLSLAACGNGDVDDPSSGDVSDSDEVKQVRGSKSWVKIEISHEYIRTAKSKKQYLADRDDFIVKI